jgi:parallel beta-helix repeat protein
MSPWAISLVQNIDTGMSYHSIQEAIDTIETLGGHTLRVDPGIYHEHVNIHKPLTIIGENCTTTIIDGNHIGTVLHVTADNVSISGFSIRNSGSHFPPYGDDCGVLLDHVSGVSFKHNRITNNRIGVYLFFSSGNSLEYNNVSSNDENGIWLWYSGGNTLVDNHILNNSYNFGVFGGTFSDFNNTITKGNTVDGKPIYYLIGAEDEILDDQTNIGVLYLINCHNMTVRDLRFSKNGQGILYYGGTSSRIENVTVLDSNYGIHIQGSNNTIIRNNRCSRNWVGILLLDSSNNLADSNIVERGEKGVSLYEASENILRENTLLNNLYGFRLYSSHSNELYHNNLIGNSEHANCLFSYQNTWDNGFEGNFWGSFVGSDIVKDGLGDSPHNIDGNNRDLYPLLGMFQNFTLQHENETHSISLISNSTIHHIALESNGSAIRLTVNGTDGTYGFCRISIPHAFLEPEFSILIDNRSSEVLYANYTLLNDGFRSWIYFVYNHSTHEIIIIPEYFPFTILLILICTTYYICWMRQKYKRRP